MKNLKKAGIILLVISTIMSLINITPITMAETYEQYIADKSVTKMNKGDEILFDNTPTNWENIYIYIWQENSGEYKSWNSADAMTKIEGTNIYKFIVPNEDVFDENNYDHIIFKNGYDGNQNQTISLGFIESGLCYMAQNSVETEYDINGEWIKDRKIGYWYLYDKSSITEHLQSSIQYQQNKLRYTDESYKNLDELITQAAQALENEIILYAYKDEYNNDMNLYYLNISTYFKAIDEIIDNLEIYKGKINIQTDGNGTVVTNQADNSQVEVGTNVNLTINPNENYELDQINITDSNSNNVQLDNNTFTMPRSDVDIDATFKKIQRSIITTSENGSVTTNQADDSKVDIGEEVVLTLTPNQWCELESLTVKDEDDNDIEVNNNTFIMPGKNVSINAIFKERNVLHNIIINETENGSIVTDVGPEDVRVETPVNITTTPNYGYELDTIVVKDAEGHELEVTNNQFRMPDSNAEITATFKHIKKSITLNSTEGGSVTINQEDNSKVNVGETVELNLTKEEYYELDKLEVKDEEENNITVTDNTFVMLNSNVTVNASFRRITKAITISNSGDGETKLNVDDLKKVNAGQEVTISAEPAENWEVQDIIVTDEQGNKLEIVNNSFIMPTNNVLITTIFKTDKTNSGEQAEPTGESDENKGEQAESKDNQADNKENQEESKENQQEAKNQNNEINQKQNNNTPKTGDMIEFAVIGLIVSIIIFLILSRRKKEI